MVVKYQKSSEHPTGKCAVLITGQDRSLVTKLDAANHFTTAHLDDKSDWALVEGKNDKYSFKLIDKTRSASEELEVIKTVFFQVPKLCTHLDFS